MIKTKALNIIAVVLILGITIISCNNNENSKIDNTNIVETKKDSFNRGMPEFLNSLNVPEMELPVAGHFSSPNSIDTLDYEMKESDEYLFDFKLFEKRNKKNALNITIASEVHFYNEGDLDGDGTEEIGILPGYTSSACRSYAVYSFKNRSWKLLFEIPSHLGDRERGIDYVKREGDSIRILQANEDCCQCYGLDTAYVKIKKIR